MQAIASPRVTTDPLKHPPSPPSARAAAVSGHTLDPVTSSRTIVIRGDRDPVPIVFEMVGPTVVVEPGESVRLVVTGPEDAELTIGYGRNGISIFRDAALGVDVFGPDGERIDTAGFA